MGCRSLSRTPSRLCVRPSGASQGSLSVTRLLDGLGKEGRKGLGAARKELEKLEKSATPLDAPLPSNISKQIEREVGEAHSTAHLIHSHSVSYCFLLLVCEEGGG